jgi:hypothetical protein
MLHGDLVAARNALFKLLVGRVKFTPIELKNGDRTYELEAEMTVGRLVATAVQTWNVPDGISYVCTPSDLLIRQVKVTA